MQVTLLIHLELAEGDAGPQFVWWAESPDIEGFSAAADHLPDLLADLEVSIPAILHERGDDIEIEIVHRLAATPEPTGSPAAVPDDQALRVLVVA